MPFVSPRARRSAELALLLLLLGAGAARAAAPLTPQASAPGAASVETPTKADDSSAKPEDLVAQKKSALERASSLAKEGRYPAAEEVATELAKKLGDRDPFPDEIRGAIYTIKKDFPAAAASFRAMLAKSPESPVARFNLAETQFLARRYGEAEQSFAELESAQRETNPAVADLCRYKRVVSLLAAGSPDKAKALLPPPSDTPPSAAVRYAGAAVDFSQKNVTKANSEIEEARRAFSAEVESLYVDSFIELHWGTRDSAGHFNFSSAPK